MVNAKITNKYGPSSLIVVGFNKEEYRKAYVRIVILDKMSFSFVENEGFWYFCSVACPKSHLLLEQQLVGIFISFS